MRKKRSLGYVSLEVVIICAVVLTAGIGGIAAFTKNGQSNHTTMVEKEDEVYYAAWNGNPGETGGNIGGGGSSSNRPGLYDENDVLLYSWDVLVNDYGFNVEKDYDDTTNSPGEILKTNNDLKNGTKLIVPEGVSKIGKQAFVYVPNLKSIILPESIISIGDYAFSECTSLRAQVPDSVINFGRVPFEYIDVLCYDGTATDEYGRKKFGADNWHIDEDSNGHCDECGDELGVIPGLYDGDGNLMYDWNTLVNDYNINIEDDYGWDNENTPGFHLVYNEDLKDGRKLVIGEGITKIGDYALADMYGLHLKEVIIPESVTIIGDYAFAWLNELRIHVPDNVTSIGIAAFDSVDVLCYNGTAVDEDGGVKWGAKNLHVDGNLDEKCDLCNKTIGLQAGLYRDGSLIMSWTSLLDEGIIHLNSDGVLTTNYDGEAFNSSSATLNGKLVLSKDVKILGAMAFEACTRLTEVIIPDTVEKIMWSAFNGCQSLTTIDIPESVTYIGSCAFYETGLTSIMIPKSVISIADAAFSYKNNLEVIIVDEDNPVYDSRDNCNAIIETATNKLISGCNTTTIPDSVTTIGAHSFYMLENLKTITIPDSVTNIETYAFYGCLNLNNVYIPNSVETIASNTFYLSTNNNIYCEANSKPSGWKSNWYYRTQITYDVTADEYLEFSK